MSLSIGIVGLPNVGKSTLFNALTKKSVEAANYPFCTIDPSVGVVAVPDERLHKLSALLQSVKTLPAAVEFVDIAGLVKGASEGEGLGNKFLANIRETDAILEVVRIFEDENIIHVAGGVNPVFDIQVINLELIQADLQVVTKRIGSIGREVKRGDKEAVKEQGILNKLDVILKDGKLANTIKVEEDEKDLLKNLCLLTTKPILYALNKKSGGKNLDEMKDPRYTELLAYLKEMNAGYVIIDAGIEESMKDFADSEKKDFKTDMGMTDDGISELIKKGYEILNLITYFTTGPEETRAWTIQKGWTAPLAGTAIHTDFKDKFVRAEIIHWDKLLEAGSYAKARELGWIKTEGKEYVVLDGDVIEFKI